MSLNSISVPSMFWRTTNILEGLPRIVKRWSIMLWIWVESVVGSTGSAYLDILSVQERANWMEDLTIWGFRACISSTPKRSLKIWGDTLVLIQNIIVSSLSRFRHKISSVFDHPGFATYRSSRRLQIPYDNSCFLNKTALSFSQLRFLQQSQQPVAAQHRRGDHAKRRVADKDETLMSVDSWRVFDECGNSEHPKKPGVLCKVGVRSPCSAEYMKNELLPLSGLVFCRASVNAGSARKASGMIS